MRALLVVMVVGIGVLGTQPARAQTSASSVVSVTILDPVGVGEGETITLDPMAASRGGASALHGRYALDGSDERMVSIASAAGPLRHAGGSDRLSLDVRANRTSGGFKLSGGVTASAGATPGVYAGAVSVVVNYN